MASLVFQTWLHILDNWLHQLRVVLVEVVQQSDEHDNQVSSWLRQVQVVLVGVVRQSDDHQDQVTLMVSVCIGLVAQYV